MRVRHQQSERSARTDSNLRHAQGSVLGLTQLDDDLAASVERDKFLRIWRISDTQEVGRWKHNEVLTAIPKLDRSRIDVGDANGGVFILKHFAGTSIHVKKKITSFSERTLRYDPKIHCTWPYEMTVYRAHCRGIRHIAVHQNRFLTCSMDATVIYGLQTHSGTLELPMESGKFMILRCFQQLSPMSLSSPPHSTVCEFMQINPVLDFKLHYAFRTPQSMFKFSIRTYCHLL